MSEYGVLLATAVVGTAAEASPLVIAAVTRHRVSAARAWVLAWCGLGTVINGVSFWTAFNHIHNIWLIYPLFPVTVAQILWALSCWQVADVPRLTFRIAIVPFAVVWVVLTQAFENTSSFSRLAQPVGCLVGLAAAAYTLVVLSQRARGDLLRQDWFWICAGLALDYASLVAVGPLGVLLVTRSPDLVGRAYIVKNLVELFAMLAIARGIWLPPSAAEAR